VVSVGSTTCNKQNINKENNLSLYCLQSVVTLSLSYMVGTVASYHNTDAVVIALGSTLVISFTIIIFSAQVFSVSL